MGGNDGVVIGASNKTTALVFDLEFWHSAELLKPYIKGNKNDYIVESMVPLLKLLDTHGYKATFATLGLVAEKYPHLVELIFSKGHEIASHSYSHKMINIMTPSQFEEDLLRSVEIIYSITGVRPIGYRAPSFSINNNTKWALKILVKHGFRYDASIAPLNMGLYGHPGVPLHPYRVNLDNISLEDPQSPLIEFPMTVLDSLIKIPMSGGFYMRILPVNLIIYALNRVIKNRPALVYIHPWETYKGTPKCAAPPFNRFVSYYGINSTFTKLSKLLSAFQFTSIYDLLNLA